MTKINKPKFLYRVGRRILGPVFKSYYRPTIIGKENIIEEGPVIFAGNHIHLYDQCHTIISSKRNITFMAKKEYFESKKTRWFFKSVGCIPVDRTKKDNDAVNSALSILKQDGAIGIFPEGTRNALKIERTKEIHDQYFEDIDFDEFNTKLMESKPRISEVKYLCSLYADKKINKKELNDGIYHVDKILRKLLKDKKITEDEYLNANLMDLKFGAVSMAKKTNASIVPIIITGDYVHHGSNLKVRYGKPFKVDNMELPQANEKLRKDMIELMRLNLKEELEKL